jgi:hypothetical protein
MTGSGHHPTVSISKPLVETWTQAVEGFGNDLFSKIETRSNDEFS